MRGKIHWHCVLKSPTGDLFRLKKGGNSADRRTGGGYSQVKSQTEKRPRACTREGLYIWCEEGNILPQESAALAGEGERKGGHRRGFCKKMERSEKRGTSDRHIQNRSKNSGNLAD